MTVRARGNHPFEQFKGHHLLVPAPSIGAHQRVEVVGYVVERWNLAVQDFAVLFVKNNITPPFSRIPRIYEDGATSVLAIRLLSDCSEFRGVREVWFYNKPLVIQRHRYASPMIFLFGYEMQKLSG